MSESRSSKCRAAVIWIDWYAYHVARLRGLESSVLLRGSVQGFELVGGIGVHHGLKFREALPEELPIETLMPEASWQSASKLRLARLLWQRLSELRPEVVLVPGYYTLPAMAAALWTRCHGCASVLMTESTARDHGRSAWRELLKRSILRAFFDWAVTGGKAHVEYLRQLGFPGDRIVGCYDVVDNELFRAGAATFRNAPGGSEPYFLYVGRLAEEKNIARLLASWIAYRRQGGTWKLVLCGDGPEREALRNAALDAGLSPYVHFAGLKTSTGLLPFYANAGCFVLPSTREPWGLVANEAMSAGLPVLISTRCGCCRDLVDEGANGFSFDPRNVYALTELLHRMESLSPEERARLGRRSEEIIGNFTPEGFGEAIASIVRRIQRRTEATLSMEVAQ